MVKLNVLFYPSTLENFKAFLLLAYQIFALLLIQERKRESHFKDKYFMRLKLREIPQYLIVWFMNFSSSVNWVSQFWWTWEGFENRGVFNFYLKLADFPQNCWLNFQFVHDANLTLQSSHTPVATVDYLTILATTQPFRLEVCRPLHHIAFNSTQCAAVSTHILQIKRRKKREFSISFLFPKMYEYGALRDIFNFSKNFFLFCTFSRWCRVSYFTEYLSMFVLTFTCLWGSSLYFLFELKVGRRKNWGTERKLDFVWILYY